MVTLTFKAEKASKELIIIPTLVVDYSNKEKATIELCFGWLNGMLSVYINWTRKAKNSTTNEAKCN